LNALATTSVADVTPAGHQYYTHLEEFSLGYFQPEQRITLISEATAK